MEKKHNVNISRYFYYLITTTNIPFVLISYRCHEILYTPTRRWSQQENQFQMVDWKEGYKYFTHALGKWPVSMTEYFLLLFTEACSRMQHQSPDVSSRAIFRQFSSIYMSNSERSIIAFLLRLLKYRSLRTSSQGKACSVRQNSSLPHQNRAWMMR